MAARSATRRPRLGARLLLGIAASAALAVGWLPINAARAATPTTLTIGLDNVAPAGHNWEYTDFFPRDNVTVTSGDVLHFSWNPAPDGFHTATLLPTGQTPAQAWQANPLIAPDSDDGARQTQINPAVGNPTNPPPGSGAPGACGDAATPCTFDGSKLLNSGPTGAPADFFVKVTAAPGSYNVVCLIHPGMQLAFTVGTTASTQSSLDSAASAQHQADTAEATTAEDAVSSASTTTNADGTRTITAHAGAAGPHELIDEMLPAHLSIHPGDKVTWDASSNNIHTVSFPAGVFSPNTEPFNGFCENASGADSPANGPPPSGCNDPTASETHFNPAPFGGPIIHHGGYRLGARDGGVFTYGNAPYLGSASQVHPKSPIVSLVSTSDNGGYWQAGADGGVFTFGDAPFLGSAAGKVSAPIVSMFAAPDASAYALVGSDGKVYPFGQIPPGLQANLPSHLAAPIVGSAVNNSAPGFWLAGADGGVFTVGQAPFLGSAGALHLAKPIVGIQATPDGGGYWLVASDGGIFTYGDAAFFGSLGALKLNAPIVGMAVTSDGGGYYLYAADGGVFTFGNARFFGSAGNVHLASPVNTGAIAPGTLATSGVISQAPLPFPTSYTFAFPEAGSFSYQCRIHDHMRADLSVS